jgi:bacterioferritin-associated ferredoxin
MYVAWRTGSGPAHPVNESAMYVCNCNALTQKQVREAIKNRPRDVEAVYRYHQCQPQCGRCVPDIREMLDEARETEAA